MMHGGKVRRSMMFVPIVVDRFVDEAWRRGADVLILDLEDSVPADRKDEARRRVAGAVAKVARGGAEVAVRINHDTMEEDVAAAVIPGVSLIICPMVERAEDVQRLDALVGERERVHGMTPGSVQLSLLLETPRGIADVRRIVRASARIYQIGGAGGLDMTRALDIPMQQDGDPFAHMRAELELAARAVGVTSTAAPFVGNTNGLLDQDDFARYVARVAMEGGFCIGMALHPRIVGAQIAGYTPTEGDVAAAQGVLAADGVRRERGLDAVEIDGRVIDRYEAARATELLEWASMCAARDAAKRVRVQL